MESDVREVARRGAEREQGPRGAEDPFLHDGDGLGERRVPEVAAPRGGADLLEAADEVRPEEDRPPLGEVAAHQEDEDVAVPLGEGTQPAQHASSFPKP